MTRVQAETVKELKALDKLRGEPWRLANQMSELNKQIADRKMKLRKTCPHTGADGLTYIVCSLCGDSW